MQMMQNVSDQAIGFADLRWLDPVAGVVRLSNCGSQATELASTRKEIRWVPHGLQELPWKHGGMCPQCVSKPGTVTLARLSRVRGKHVLLITKGEALEKSRKDLETTYWEFSPHAWVSLEAPTEAFTDQLRSNHIHMMYGDYRYELVTLAKALGIDPIVPERMPQIRPRNA
jgi:L-fucose isomerase